MLFGIDQEDLIPDVILPEEIRNLRNFEELYLPGNGISSLPDSIGATC